MLPIKVGAFDDGIDIGQEGLLVTQHNMTL